MKWSYPLGGVLMLKLCVICWECKSINRYIIVFQAFQFLDWFWIFCYDLFIFVVQNELKICIAKESCWRLESDLLVESTSTYNKVLSCSHNILSIASFYYIWIVRMHIMLIIVHACIYVALQTCKCTRL